MPVRGEPRMGWHIAEHQIAYPAIRLDKAWVRPYSGPLIRLPPLSWRGHILAVKMSDEVIVETVKITHMSV